MNARVVLGVFALCGFAAHADDDARSPARVQLDNFLAAYNTGDRAALIEFGRAHMPPSFTDDTVIDGTLRSFHDTSGMDIFEVQEDPPLSITAWMHTRKFGDVMQLEVTVRDDDPTRIHTITLGSSELPARFRPVRSAGPAAAEAWRALEARRAADDQFSGVLYMAHGNDVLLREAFGFADREQRAPNTVATRFRTGEITQMFTAVTVLRLAQEHRISLDDPLGKRVPELAAKPLGLPTIGQYLAHLAGAGDIFDARYLEHPRDFRTHDDFLRVFGNDLLKTAPDEEFLRSSLGYELLGVMIERVTGRSYFDVVREKVFAPARMSLTGADAADPAHGYERTGVSAYGVATDRLSMPATAAWGMYSTVDDLARFFAALRSNKLLDRKHTRLLLTARTNDDRGMRFSYGLRFQYHPNGEWIGHDGNDGGSSAEAWFAPKTDYVVIVLSNFEGLAAANAADDALERLPKD